MEKCLWTTKLLAEYNVKSPGMIPIEIAEKPFLDFGHSLFNFAEGGFVRAGAGTFYSENRLPDENFELNDDYHLASRFSDDQRKILMIAQMCLFDVLRGVVHTDDGQKLVPSLAANASFQMLRQMEALPMIPVSFRDSMVSGLRDSVSFYNVYYRNLMLPLRYEFEQVGGLGVARSLIDCAGFLEGAIKGDLTALNRGEYRNDLKDKGLFVKAYSSHESQCLGPHLAFEMYEQAKTAALVLAENPLIREKYRKEVEDRSKGSAKLFMIATFRSMFENADKLAAV